MEPTTQSQWQASKELDLSLSSFMWTEIVQNICMKSTIQGFAGGIALTQCEGAFHQSERID